MRVSNLSLKNNIIFNLHKNNNNLLKTEKQLGTGKKIFNVSDNPTDAISSIYSKMRINQINQYTENSTNASDYIKITYDKLSSVTDILHRMKELTIQGANSPLNRADRINIAVEVDELLGQIISLANSSYQDNYIFSGSKGKTLPFEVSISHNQELGKDVISGVSYLGDTYKLKTEIEKNELVNISLSGSETFWAENHVLVSLKDSVNYISPRQQSIKVDGYEVKFIQGDNLDTIISKINQSVPSVNASKKTLPSGEVTLSLDSKFPHQMALEDIKGGTLFRDLGLLKQGAIGNLAFENIHPNTLEHGGSIFDVLIRLRNTLVNNDVKDLSGKSLNGIALGLENILKNQTRISALNDRLAKVKRDLSQEKFTNIERLSKKQDVDIAEASITFNELNHIHRLSLQTAAKYLRPKLLDFL